MAKLRGHQWECGSYDQWTDRHNAEQNPRKLADGEDKRFLPHTTRRQQGWPALSILLREQEKLLQSRRRHCSKPIKVH